MVLPDRIELSTSPLPRECSTTELRQQALARSCAIGRWRTQGSAPRGDGASFGCAGLRLQGEIQRSPGFHESPGQGLDMGVRVQRTRGNAQALGSTRDGRIVDRLDVDPVLLEE